jgi:hypothetical protein
MVIRALDRKVAAAGRTGRGAEVAPSVAAGPAPASPALALLERDVFVCSELERAAYCLSSVDGALAELLEQCAAADQQREEAGWEESKEGELSPSRSPF